MEVGNDPTIRVQALAEAGLSRVPPQYIQLPHQRPQFNASTTSSCNSNIPPVIDLFYFEPSRRNSVRNSIGPACREWGAFHVTNHGVPTSLLAHIKTVGLTFFEQCPIPDKLKYSCDPSSFASQGYGSRMLLLDKDNPRNEGNVVLDWRDYFDHHTFPLSRRNPSLWPHFPPDYRETVDRYADQMKALAQKLMGLISESLGLSSSCIEDAVGELFQNITISYYPPCPQPDLTLGLQTHSDMGAITLLIQDDVGGLQLLNNDQWVTVPPLSDAVLVILADQTEVPIILANFMKVLAPTNRGTEILFLHLAVDSLIPRCHYTVTLGAFHIETHYIVLTIESSTDQVNDKKHSFPIELVLFKLDNNICNS